MSTNALLEARATLLANAPPASAASPRTAEPGNQSLPSHIAGKRLPAASSNPTPDTTEAEFSLLQDLIAAYVRANAAAKPRSPLLRGRILHAIGDRIQHKIRMQEWQKHMRKDAKNKRKDTWDATSRWVPVALERIFDRVRRRLSFHIVVRRTEADSDDRCTTSRS